MTPDAFELQIRREIEADRAEILRLEAVLSRNWIERLKRRPPLYLTLREAQAAGLGGPGEACAASDSTAAEVPRVKRDWLSRG